MVFANQSMADHHDSILDQEIKSSEDATLSQRVEQMIKQHLPTGEPTIQHAARTLNMSPRTMQRHLRAETTSFRALLDEVRKTRAGDYVARSVPIPLDAPVIKAVFTKELSFYIFVNCNAPAKPPVLFPA